MDGGPELRAAEERARMHGKVDHDKEERQWERGRGARADATVRLVRGRYLIQTCEKSVGKKGTITILQCNIHGKGRVKEAKETRLHNSIEQMERNGEKRTHQMGAVVAPIRSKI